MARAPRVAEFFAGIGLVRKALESEGFRIVFANDIEPTKAVIYQANFDASDLVVGDVCAVRGRDVPDIDVATASFPCTDLSCLRTARGGSSKQAVVETGHGEIRARWMRANEYARLQGAPDFRIEDVSENAAIFGFGDAVCVPAVAWVARTYLLPCLSG